MGVERFSNGRPQVPVYEVDREQVKGAYATLETHPRYSSWVMISVRGVVITVSRKELKQALDSA